ncbi:hypothetical protein [uncultured Tateyamaria sp.]|uniref:hypothetical protein n=1 Tax=uncultured Tateyamaria sp. TaxID=455651 RepID=UPI002614E1E4|nr:hypothetical protein [uncultured Tateyamaria sp.]
MDIELIKARLLLHENDLLDERDRDLLTKLVEARLEVKLLERFARSSDPTSLASQVDKRFENYLKQVAVLEPELVEHLIKQTIFEAQNSLREQEKYERSAARLFPRQSFSFVSRTSYLLDDLLTFIVPSALLALVAIGCIAFAKFVQFEPISITANISMTNIPAYIALGSSAVTLFVGAIWLFGDD